MKLEQGHRPITDDEIEQYDRDGVVHLRGILDPDWLDVLRQGLREVFYDHWGERDVQYDATALARDAAAAGMDVLADDRSRDIQASGRFLTAISAATYNERIRRVALESPLGSIAGALFGADKVNFYDDQILLKEPGAREYTAFHTDEPYYHLSGTQVCGMWVSPDPVGPDNSPMRYVRGSHRWGTYYLPNAFVSQQPTWEGEGKVRLPDVEGNEDDYDIVTITSEPGDVIVHHSNLIHGSKANYDPDLARWAGSFRYAGDDVRYLFQASAPPQPHHQHDLTDGDVLDSDQFPVVWRRDPTGGSPDER